MAALSLNYWRRDLRMRSLMPKEEQRELPRGQYRGGGRSQCEGPEVLAASCPSLSSRSCSVTAAFGWPRFVSGVPQWLLMVSACIGHSMSSSLPLVRISHLDAFDPRSCGIKSLNCSKSSFISVLLFRSASLWLTRNSGVLLYGCEPPCGDVSSL